MRVNWNSEWIMYSAENAQRINVTLPHDAMIHETRSPENPSGSAGAGFPGGKYIYEKHFEAPKEWKNKCICLEFEGVYQKAQILVNGKCAGGCIYGYNQFRISMGEFLKYGEDNTIQVIADNTEQPNSRWYTGSGIYRPVWLWVKEKYHILPHGVKITTLSYDPAVIRIQTEHTGGEVKVEILYHNQKVADGSGDNIELTIPNAKLWSDDTPELYECRVTLHSQGKEQDGISEHFGIRTLKWGAEGFFVNGKNTLLRGGCVHHDGGILGAACYEKSEFRRIRILKEAGYNAVRSAHNPASEALLEACDFYGMYVMDESWDMWYRKKNKYDYANYFEDHYKEDLKCMVEKDYNHPSVIMYSIGNEISEPGEEKGLALEKEMVSILHDLDTSRPVTCGMNLSIIKSAAEGNSVYKEDGGRNKEGEKKNLPMDSKQFNILTAQIGAGMNMAANSEEADRITSSGLDALDIAGYNYASGRYPLEGELHPDRIILGSETFPFDIYKNWEMVKRYPYLIGDFMWTAWDYLGESGGGAWGYTPDSMGFEKPYPWLLAEMGAFDILGNENAQAGYASVVWGKRTDPYLAVQPVNHPDEEPMKSVWRGTNAIPSWSWKNCEGNEAVVEVYADAAKAELYLNGKKQGEMEIDEKKALFSTTYQPGILETVVYDKAGKVLGRNSLKSAAGELHIGLHPEESIIAEGDIVYIPVAIEDHEGTVETNADVMITICVKGGELLGFGSANPRTEESYTAGCYKTYYGRALAVVRAGNSDGIEVSVSSEGMEVASVHIVVKND